MYVGAIRELNPRACLLGSFLQWVSTSPRLNYRSSPVHRRWGSEGRMPSMPYLTPNGCIPKSRSLRIGCEPYHPLPQPWTTRDREVKVFLERPLFRGSTPYLTHCPSILLEVLLEGGLIAPPVQHTSTPKEKRKRYNQFWHAQEHISFSDGGVRRWELC